MDALKPVVDGSWKKVIRTIFGAPKQLKDPKLFHTMSLIPILRGSGLTPMEHGKFQVPADATAIAPPKVDPGQMLFFNSREQLWEVCSLSQGMLDAITLP